MNLDLTTVQGRLQAMFAIQNALLTNGELTKAYQEPFNRVIKHLMTKHTEQQLAATKAEQ